MPGIVPHTTRWNNEPGTYVLEVGPADDGEWIVAATEKPAPQALVTAIKELFPDEAKEPKTIFQVEIDYLMSGYFTDKTWDSDSEGENVPELDSITVSPPNPGPGYNESKGKKLPQQLAESLYSIYESEIEEECREKSHDCCVGAY
jgi:hypothetical protein